MLVNFFLNSTPLWKQKQILMDFADSVGGRCVKKHDRYEECDVAVVFGSWKKTPTKEWKNDFVRHHHVKQTIIASHKDKPLIVLETPLLGRTIAQIHGNYRVGLQHYMHGLADFKNKNSKSDRFDNLKLKVSPWRKKGEHILLMGQNMTDASLFGIDFQLWVTNTIHYLRKHTDREIRFRDHPENKNLMKNHIQSFAYKNVTYSKNEDIKKDFKNAHCTVSYTSGSSIDSILAGIPVIPCNEYNFLWPISSHSLSDIENPKCGEREQLLYDLAYAQWSVEEIRQGKPWHHLISK
jgi:hypothetical protein